MRSNVKLSTKFLTTQDAHQVGLLVTVAGEAPAERPPINVSLVIDRSGSMSGPPLHEAREAAIRFARFLGPQDRLSVVAFDDQVITVWGPAPAGDPAVEQSIRAIASGGTTNLSGGWLKGREHVQSGLVEGTNRVVLLTDGCANQGITDLTQLNGLARGALSDKISTTCIGFGAHFQEDLLKAMSDAGGGNYWYVEETDQMGSIFDEEIEGLVALAAQNLEVVVRLADPRVQGVTLLQDYPVTRDPDGAWRVVLGDLYATSPRQLGLIFHVEHVTHLGEIRLGEVTISSDLLLEEGVEHRTTMMPVIANLDGRDHVEPEVERTITRFEAAKLREEAVEQADRGDYRTASEKMREAAEKLAPYGEDEAVRSEIQDLAAASERVEMGDYGPADRKYNMARSEGVWRDKKAYMKKIARLKKMGLKPRGGGHA